MNYVDNPFKSPLTSISIGPGIRGIERGVERVAGLIHLAYVEIEAFIIENLVAEMEQGLLAPAVIWSDAKTCRWEIFRGIVDILFAGYPCQPFSTAGKRRGAEDPRHLYPYIEGAIRIIRPRICFFENVRGHVTCGLPEVVASLEGLGYRVHWGIYSAEETGAAHKRERIFILAMVNSELQSIDSSIGRIWRESDSAGSELGNTAGANEQLERVDKASGEKTLGGYGNDGMANAINNGHSNGSGEIPSEKEKTEGQTHREERNQEVGERVRDESEYSNIEELANDRGFRIREGLEWRPSKQFDENGRKWIVSRPGQPQQAWEHPRVISRKTESLVGLSAHGYHFREDILRALGNSVYEDTAELAFRDLVRKHGIAL